MSRVFLVLNDRSVTISSRRRLRQLIILPLRSSVYSYIGIYDLLPSPFLVIKMTFFLDENKQINYVFSEEKNGMMFLFPHLNLCIHWSAKLATEIISILLYPSNLKDILTITCLFSDSILMKKINSCWFSMLLYKVYTVLLLKVSLTGFFFMAGLYICSLSSVIGSLLGSFNR